MEETVNNSGRIFENKLGMEGEGTEKKLETNWAYLLFYLRLYLK